jgi:hypothetical protein
VNSAKPRDHGRERRLLPRSWFAFATASPPVWAVGDFPLTKLQPAQSPTSLHVGTGTHSHHDAQSTDAAGCAGSSPMQLWQSAGYCCAPTGTHLHHDAQPPVEVSSDVFSTSSWAVGSATLAKRQPLQSDTSRCEGTGTHSHHEAQPDAVGLCVGCPSAPLQFWQAAGYCCAPGGTHWHHDAQPTAEVSSVKVPPPA